MLCKVKIDKLKVKMGNIEKEAKFICHGRELIDTVSSFINQERYKIIY